MKFEEAMKSLVAEAVRDADLRAEEIPSIDLYLDQITSLVADKLKDLLLSFMVPSCLFGGVAALLIATNSSLNGGWILSVQYFGYHVSISVFAIALLRGSEYPLTIKRYFNCLKFLVVLMLFAIYINSILYDGVSNINFMYVASPPKSGLPFLTEEYGWLVYICHYAFTVVFCVTLCYIKPIVAAIRAKCCRKQNVNV